MNADYDCHPTTTFYSIKHSGEISWLIVDGTNWLITDSRNADEILIFCSYQVKLFKIEQLNSKAVCKKCDSSACHRLLLSINYACFFCLCFLCLIVFDVAMLLLVNED